MTYKPNFSTFHTYGQGCTKAGAAADIFRLQHLPFMLLHVRITYHL